MIGAIDWLEASFLIVVGSMSLLAGLFALYAAVQLFRNPGVRSRKAAR
jgi:hypothetical protein